MCLLEDLERAILVSKNLVDRALTSKLYRSLTEKLSRKIKRGLGILGDLKSTQEGPHRDLCSKHLHSVIKNYLSVADAAMKLLNSYDEKSVVTKYINADSGKKELYGLLNDIEQAIHELDTEACLHERLVFDRYKASIVQPSDSPAPEATPLSDSPEPAEVAPVIEQELTQEPEDCTPPVCTEVAPTAAEPALPVEIDVLSQLNQITLEEPKPCRQLSQSAAELNRFVKAYCLPRSKLEIQSHSQPRVRQYCVIQKHAIAFSSRINDLVDEKTYRSGRPEVLALFLQEVTNLHQLQGSPYIVRFYGLTQSASPSTEYMAHSSLLETTLKGSVFDAVQTQHLSFGTTLGLMEDVAHGLAYLHDTHGFVHCNLNAHNVLITAADRAKITGFEFASSVSDVAAKPSPLAVLFPQGLDDATGTCDLALNWLDPCLARDPDQAFSPKNDIYSYGLLFWFMFARASPFEGRTCGEILHTLRRGGTEDISRVPPQYHGLLLGCWASALSTRPEAKALLRLLSEPVHELHNFQQLHLQPSFSPAPNPIHIMHPQGYPPMGFVPPTRPQQMASPPPAAPFFPSMPFVPGMHQSTNYTHFPSQGNFPSPPSQFGYTQAPPHTPNFPFPGAPNGYRPVHAPFFPSPPSPATQATYQAPPLPPRRKH